MNKSLMISIRPEHAFNILNGNKTLELRKTVPKDFKGWVYIYCTKGKPYLGKNHDGNIGLYNIPAFGHFNKSGDLNGKVVARFWFDEYEEIEYVKSEDDYYMRYDIGIYYKRDDDFFKKLQLSRYDLWEYGNDKDLYAWHIKQLEIFDTPLSLSDFYKATLYSTGQVIKEYEQRTNDFKSYRLKRPPQSWQYVYVRGNLRNE